MLVTKHHQAVGSIYQQVTASERLSCHSKPANPAPGCTISLALPFLLTLGLTLKKSLSRETLAVNQVAFLWKKCYSSALRPWQARNRLGAGCGQLDLNPPAYRYLFINFSKITPHKKIWPTRKRETSVDTVTVDTSETSSVWPRVNGTASPQTKHKLKNEGSESVREINH